MSENDEKKLFVDEDWKSKAQAEKQKLSEELDKKATGEGAGEIPQPTLLEHVQSLATQAMMWLGVVDNPFMDGKRVFDPGQSRYLIDLVGVLEEKTRGNRDKDEDAYFERLLPELRMIYVEVGKQAAAQQAAEGGDQAGGAAGAGGGAGSIITE